MAQRSLRLSTLIVLVIAVGGNTAAFADIQNITTFVGDKSESFESWPDQPYFVLNDIFQGTGTATSLNENNLYVASSWFKNSYTFPQSGTKLAGFAYSGVHLDFNMSVYAIGGYFGSVSLNEGGSIRFFDSSGEVGLASITMPLGGAMTWNGWQSSQAFTSLEIISNDPDSLGGWFAMDNLQIATSPVPEPSTPFMLLVGIGLVWGVTNLRKRPWLTSQNSSSTTNWLTV